MSAWLNQILADPDTKKYFAERAIADPFPGNPESLKQYFAQEIPRWAELFRIAKVEPQ